MSATVIGLMSGTSLDGVDGVLADFAGLRVQLLGHCHRPFDAALRAELLALNSPGFNELQRAALAANALARVYAAVVADLLALTGLPATKVLALGAHGQTVRHQPQLFEVAALPAGRSDGYSVQLNNPALLAELTGIRVVADFRSRDVAAGGQGAPLVPAFHQALWARPERTTLVLNLGGIANLSVLPALTGAAAAPVLGFDCGPGNALLDHWCQQHTGWPFDADGAWAAGGSVQPDLLQALQAEPYLALPPPKSTGRDSFNPAWLERLLVQTGATARPPADIQATLSEFTASACADCVNSYQKDSDLLLVCGGGALNLDLLRRLQRRLPQLTVASTQSVGIDPMQVEATAFAWLAWRTLNGQTGNLPSVTGAAGARVLGAIYPA